MGSSSDSLPLVDFAAFYGGGGGDHEEVKKRAVEEISRACSGYGFFQVVNHGIPLNLMKQLLDVYRTFFDLSYEKKLEFLPKSGVSPSTGYFRSPDLTKEANEHFLIISPHLGLNPYPKTFPRFQQILEEIYPKFVELAALTESIINQSLGLPANFLKGYNDNRAYDFLLGVHYFPATFGTENVGKSAHEDTSCITLLYQDDVGGLQFCKNGRWISVPPLEGALTIIIGDVLRVLSNDKYKSATHKVIRPAEKDRYSFAFFHNLMTDKWVEPLPEFSKEIGELPKYRGFIMEEYIQRRRRDRQYPPDRYEDLTRVTRYAINYQDS